MKGAAAGKTETIAVVCRPDEAAFVGQITLIGSEPREQPVRGSVRLSPIPSTVPTADRLPKTETNARGSSPKNHTTGC